MLILEILYNIKKLFHKINMIITYRKKLLFVDNCKLTKILNTFIYLYFIIFQVLPPIFEKINL